MRTFYILILTLALTGCGASKNFNEPGVADTPSRSSSRTYRASYSDVWTATTAALESQKFVVASSQRNGGVIQTDWVQGKSDRLYSGFGETRIPYNIRFRFTLELKPSREGIGVKIVNEEQYYSDSVTAGIDFSGSIYQWIPTESSRAKEDLLLNEIGVELTEKKGDTRK